MKRIPIAEPEIGVEEATYVAEALKSGWVSSKGPFIDEFEHMFAKLVGVKHGISTSNGTTAIHLALAALGIGAGDEVIVPTLTFIACANAIKYTGATPIFVDSDSRYWCLDPDLIEEKINSRTRAILVVHLYGHPCDMKRLIEIAEKHNLWLVEDCAEAHGALFHGKMVGSFGVVSCFSFYGNKIMTTGEGGMCLTDDDHLAERMRILRDHGMNPKKKYWHDVIGFNYRLTNLQAAVGKAQIMKFDRLVKRKREIAAHYSDLLSKHPGINCAPEMSWAKSVFWLYTITLNDNAVDRDNVIVRLDSRGIETRPFFYPIHTLPPYFASDSYMVSEQISRMGMSLPCPTNINELQIEHVCKSLIEAINS